MAEPEHFSELEIEPTRAARLRVIAVAASAVFILGYLIFLLVGGQGDLFAPRTTLTSFMPDATGLIAGGSGSEVRLSGIRIGYVKTVQISSNLDPQHAVRVEMRVRSRYLKNIPSDSQTDISTDTLVGYQFVDIAEGMSPIPIGENGMLDSQPAKQALIQADLVKTLQDELNSVDQLLADASSPKTQIGQLIVGEDLYDQVLAGVRGFDSALHAFLTPGSNLDKAFNSLEEYNNTRNLVLNVDQQLASIQNGEGTAGHLFASDEQFTTLVRQLVDLRSQLADISAKPILRDDADYARIRNMLKAADSLLTSLNAGEGQAGRLLTNAQLYESLNGSLKEMENMLRDLRQNPRKYLRIKVRH